MEIRICPDCKKAFYTSCQDDYLLCRHCGHVLRDRRGQTRIEESLDFICKINKTKKSFRLIDYSTDGNGMRVLYSGSSLPVEMVLNIDVDELDIHRPGRAVWTKRLKGSKRMSGLRLYKHV